MSKQTMIGGGAILALLAGGTGGDPTALVDLLARFSWQQMAVIGAVVIAALLIDSPATKAKLRDLTARASVPPPGQS